MRRFMDVAIGSLAEVDAMIATLGDLYKLDAQLVNTTLSLRRQINAQLFALLRGHGR